MTRHPTIGFRVEFIGAIRRGEKTQTRRPVRMVTLEDGRRTEKACGLHVGHLYELEAVDEVRREEGQNVYYDWRRTALGEYLHVLDRHQERLCEVSEADTAAEGFPDSESLMDFMRAVYGRKVDRVWVIEFELARDVPQLLHKLGGYTPFGYEAVPTEPEAVDVAYLNRFAGQAEQERKRQREIVRLEARKQALEARIAEIRRRAA